MCSSSGIARFIHQPCLDTQVLPKRRSEHSPRPGHSTLVLKRVWNSGSWSFVLRPNQQLSFLWMKGLIPSICAFLSSQHTRRSEEVWQSIGWNKIMIRCVADTNSKQFNQPRCLATAMNLQNRMLIGDYMEAFNPFFCQEDRHVPYSSSYQCGL